MQKTKMFILLVAVAVLAGCGNKATNNETGGQTQPKTQNDSKAGGVISSIKDAMGLGATMKCVYKEKDENGNDITSEAYVKGQKFKATNVIEGKKVVTLMDGEAVYNWNEGEKTGTMMKIDCLEDLNKDTKKPDYEEGEEPVEGEYVTDEAFDDARDVNCQEASGIEFSAPKDIVFTDQCEGMRNLINSGPALQEMPDMPDVSEMPDMPGVPSGE